METGTFKGDTIDLIKTQFKRIHSIELSKEYYEAAINRFQDMPHIRFLHGDSGDSIRLLRDEFKDSSTLFWLDAHWCVAANTAGERSQCPLLTELKSIESLNENSVIIIDDARLFLTTVPAPHETSDWPTLTEVIQHLLNLSHQHELVVLNDCILFFPKKIKHAVHEHAYKNGIDWLTVLDKSRDYDLLLKQLIEKEEQIKEMDEQINALASICAERETELIKKEKSNQKVTEIIKDKDRRLQNVGRSRWKKMIIKIISN